MHLNSRSLVKKIDQLRLLLKDGQIDVVTFSETWLKPYMHSDVIKLDGYKSFRLDRGTKASRVNVKKRGGGLITYIHSKHAQSCEPLEHLDASNVNIEAQWLYIDRPSCKNVIACNLYRPPNGDLKKL